MLVPQGTRGKEDGGRLGKGCGGDVKAVKCRLVFESEL